MILILTTFYPQLARVSSILGAVHFIYTIINIELINISAELTPLGFYNKQYRIYNNNDNNNNNNSLK